MASRIHVCVLFHNLKPEGAQRAMMVAMIGLAQRAGGKEEKSFRALTLQDGPLRSNLEEYGIPVTVMDTAEAMGKEAALVRGARSTIVFVNTIMLHPAIVGIREQTRLSSASDENLCVVWAIHESDPATLFSQDPNLESNLGNVAGGVDAFVFVAQAAVKEYAALPALQKYANARFNCIYNGVDIDRIAKTHATPGLRQEMRAALLNDRADNAVLFVTVGTPKRRKGQVGLVRALSRVRQVQSATMVAPTAELVVVGCVGDSEYEREMKAEAERFGVQKYVHMVGQGDSLHVARHLAASDVYCCNSEIETLPLAILEAMVCMLPVVSTDISGIPEEVDDGVTGLLYAPGQEHALDAALLDLAHDSEMRHRMGQAGCDKVKAMFSVDSMVDGYAGMVDRLVGEKPA